MALCRFCDGELGKSTAYFTEDGLSPDRMDGLFEVVRVISEEP